jgi:transcriptional regulator with XRE-family HTH domain
MVTLSQVKTKSMGISARKVRLALGLSQQQLAILTGLPREAIYQFEHNLPVCLDARRIILKELWAKKISRIAN